MCHNFHFFFLGCRKSKVFLCVSHNTSVTGIKQEPQGGPCSCGGPVNLGLLYVRSSKKIYLTDI